MAEAGCIHIRGGRLIDPRNDIDRVCDLYISKGKVAAVGQAPTGFVADQTIAAEGRIVCPGLIDLNAAMREPGQEHKATIASETSAAAANGITTLCCPPDTNPIIDTPAVADLVRHKAMQAGKARLIPVGALTQGLGGEHLSEMAALQQAGCPVLGNATKPISNTLVLRRALEYATTFGMTVFLRPEDPYLRDGGCVHEGLIATRLGLPAIPEAAETVAIARECALAYQTEAKVHFHAISSGTGARMIGRARFDNRRISADVCVHQLFLTEMDVDGFNSLCHVNPPLRSSADRQTLRLAVASGTINAICSGHRPHEIDAKEAPFPATAPGISGLDTLLPLALKLVDEGVMPLSDVIARLTSGPADVLGLDLGHLAPGAVADVCIFDPSDVWTLSPRTMHSRGANTPFLGWEFRGRVSHTLLGGHLVYTSNE